MQNKKYHLKRLKKELFSQSLKSDSDNTHGYTEIVTDAVNDEDIFFNFRNNQQYKEILSHVSKPFAKKYYKNIIKKIILEDEIPESYPFNKLLYF